MKYFTRVLAIVSIITVIIIQSNAYPGTVDNATLSPSNAIILTGTTQDMSFSATNDKAFDIKTYQAEFTYTPGLSITDIVTTPAATTAEINARKNLIIFEWADVAQGSTVTAAFTVSSSTR